MRVSLVVGHTSKEPGARAVTPILMSEYWYYISFSRMLVTALEKKGIVAHVYFRDEIGLVKTYEQIKKWKPDCSVELHFNSHQNPNAFGTETLCIEKSREFAEFIQEAQCRALKRDKEGNRGIKIVELGDHGYHSVSALDCPSVLIEPFFGSNERDCRAMSLNEGTLIKELAEAISIYGV